MKLGDLLWTPHGFKPPATASEVHIL